MYIRCTFFRGRIKPGFEGAFNLAVREELVKLQVRFPGAQEVRVLRQNECDKDEPRFELVLCLRFPSKEAIAKALASDVRAESCQLTKRILTMFDGDIIHTVFDAEEYPMANAE